MITVYIIKDSKTGVSYLASSCQERAEQWLEVANEGGCRSMGWRGSEFEIEVRHKALREGEDQWHF